MHVSTRDNVRDNRGRDTIEAGGTSIPNASLGSGTRLLNPALRQRCLWPRLPWGAVGNSCKNPVEYEEHGQHYRHAMEPACVGGYRCQAATCCDLAVMQTRRLSGSLGICWCGSNSSLRTLANQPPVSNDAPSGRQAASKTRPCVGRIPRMPQ